MEIQQSNDGHCSVEDAYATMLLVKRKLLEADGLDGNSIFEKVPFDSDEPAKKKSKTGISSPMTTVCNGCRQATSYNCRHEDCLCRSLDRISCCSCLSNRPVDQKQCKDAADLDVLTKEFPPLGGAAADQKGNCTVNVSKLLKKVKKKLLWIQGSDQSESIFDDKDKSIKHVMISSEERSANSVNEEIVRQYQASMFQYGFNVVELNGKKQAAPNEQLNLDEQIQTVVQYSPEKSLICVLFCDRKVGRESQLGICYVKVKDPYCNS